jgi:uncharacterized phiE125 gp8 family phage protein
MIKIETTPATYMEPVSLDRAKDHLRVYHNDDDAYIRDLIRAARQRAETFTGLHFVLKTLDVIFYKYSDKIKLPVNSINELVEVKFRNSSREWEAMAANNIHTEQLPFVTFKSKPINLLPETGEDQLLKVNIKVGPKANEIVPYDVQYAILLMLRTMYDNREDVVKGMTVHSLPENSTFLLRPYRQFAF